MQDYEYAPIRLGGLVLLAELRTFMPLRWPDEGRTVIGAYDD